MATDRFDSVGFVGGGRVTRFLLQGWKRAAELPENIRVSDKDASVLDRLKADFPGILACGNRQAAQTALVVLAVHPPVMKDVLVEVREALSPSVVVLSLAPKVTSKVLRSALGDVQVARMIPNAPSAIGRGFNPVSYGPNLSQKTRQALAALFRPWGDSPEVSEGNLEAYAIISAMGPTYFWFQWQTLRELAGNFGLDGQAADLAIRKMIEGAAECLLAAGLDAATVMDMIPVRPLEADESKFVASYKGRLRALHEKIRAE